MSTFGAFDAHVIDKQAELERQQELSSLTPKLNAFCDANDLPHDSADELLARLYEEEPRRVEVCQWLADFIDEWDAVA